MKLRVWIWSLLLGTAAIVAVAIAAIVIGSEHYHRHGPPAIDWNKQEALLQPLVQSHATRVQVMQAMKAELADYSSGSTNLSRSETSFFRESRNAYPRLREATSRYPGVFFHTTSETIIWLFFDSDDRLQDYFLCEQ